MFCQQNISIQPQEAKLKAVILEEGTVIITPASSTSPMKVVFHFEEAVVIKTVSLSGESILYDHHCIWLSRCMLSLLHCVFYQNLLHCV